MAKKIEPQEISGLEHSLIKLSDTFRSHNEFIQKRFGLPALEMQLIQYIMLNGPQRMKDISEHFHIKLSTFTSIVDKGERRGVLKRINSKEDRRVVHLDVSTRGKNLYKKYTQALSEFLNQMEIEWNERELSQFRSGLEAFNGYAEASA